MTSEEYKDAQLQIEMLASVVEGLQLEAFIQRAEKSLRVGPSADPKLYAEAGPKLQLVLATAKKLREIQQLNADARRQGVIK